MALLTYAEVQAFINTIYEQAVTIAREQIFVDNLVLRFGDRQGLTPRTVTQYTQATINTIGETDDMIGQDFTRTQLQTLTPAEAGGQFFLLDGRVESDPESVRQDAVTELGASMATKIETDIVGDFANLTGGTVGTSGSAFTWGNFFAGLAILQNTKAPRPYVCVLHPFQWLDLANAVTPAAAAQTNAPNFQDAVMNQYFARNVGGVDIFTTANITPNSTPDATGAMFSRSALALDIRRAPRLEPERDASRRGWELNMTSVYAHGVWRPTYGVKLVSDATTPS